MRTGKLLMIAATLIAANTALADVTCSSFCLCSTGSRTFSSRTATEPSTAEAMGQLQGSCNDACSTPGRRRAGLLVYSVGEYGEFSQTWSDITAATPANACR